MAPRPPIDRERDPFAAGHEDQTPPEVFVLRADGDWQVRVVPNLYPALSPGAAVGDGDPLASGRGEPNLFASTPALGAHEVIVNAPDAVSSLAELEPAQVETAMSVWRERMRVHGDAAYVHIIAYFERTQGRNLLEDLLQEEVRRRERIVAIDEEAVALCPFSARVPFHIQIVPRRPAARFSDDGPLGGRLLHETLRRLGATLRTLPPLNMWVRTAPRDAERFCWRIEILPRLAQLAGLEIGTGVHLKVLAPEDAAARLRAASV